MRRQAQEVILNCSVFRLDSKDPNDIAVVQLSEGKDEYEPIKFSVGRLLSKDIAYSGACFNLVYNAEGLEIRPNVQENERKRVELHGLLEEFVEEYDAEHK